MYRLVWSLLVNLKTLLNSLVVVISTTAGFTTVEETFDYLVFLDKEVKQHSFHLATLKQEFQCLRLCYGAWETIEDNALAVSRQVVEIACDEVNHLVVRYEVATSNQFANLLAEFAARFDFSAKGIACREVLQTIFLYDKVRLCALATAWGTAEDDV